MKTPEQIASDVLDGGDDINELNVVLASHDVSYAQTIELYTTLRSITRRAVLLDRSQLAAALQSQNAVPELRPFPRTSVSSLIDAYAEWNGEVDAFCLAWENYTAGLDVPCPEHPAGIHSTYLSGDSSCDFCGEKNRG